MRAVGEPTAHAVRLTAVTWQGPRWVLGIPGVVPVLGVLPGHDRTTVALPVSPRVWRMWQRRNAIGIIGVVVGVLWFVAGAVLASGVMLRPSVRSSPCSPVRIEHDPS